MCTYKIRYNLSFKTEQSTHLFCKINLVSVQHYLFHRELSCILESPTKRTSPLVSTVIQILCLRKSYVQEDWFKTDNQTSYLKQMIGSYSTLYMYMYIPALFSPGIPSNNGEFQHVT